MNFTNLDERTRVYMLDELEQDEANHRVYFSPRLSQTGQSRWTDILRDAIQHGDDASLAATLRASGYLNATLQRRKPSGGYSTAQMPVNAPDTLAEGEFNRFYIRGVCLRALADKIDHVIVYRAKAVEKPRAESEAKIGSSIDAQKVLDDLRVTQGIDTALGLPAGANSGLSVKLP